MTEREPQREVVVHFDEETRAVIDALWGSGYTDQLAAWLTDKARDILNDPEAPGEQPGS